MTNTNYRTLYTQLLSQVEAFERDSGVDPRTPWSPEIGNIGHAVRIVVECGPRRTVQRMMAVADRLSVLGKSMHGQLDKLEIDEIVSEQEELI